MARDLTFTLFPRVAALKFGYGDTCGTNRLAGGNPSGPSGAPAGTGRPALSRRIRAALRAHAERQEGRADRRNRLYALTPSRQKPWPTAQLPRYLAGDLRSGESWHRLFRQLDCSPRP